MSAHFQIMKNKKRKFSKIPKTFWWALGIIVSIAYCWTFFFFFVEPFGFRWRALYGDPTYPE